MTNLDAILHDLPYRYPGPGGAVAIVRNGTVLEQRTWGFANAEARIAFTDQTLFRMCSITKQFTCALALDVLDDLSQLDTHIAARLPQLRSAPPRTAHLCHNQSGLRDYWAVAMLLGAPAESVFGTAESRQLIAATQSLQFAPGTAYSYVNQNFRLLSDMLEDYAGRSFAELLQARLFDRHGLSRAFLAADTRAMPDGTQGYEGTEATGFRPAENRIFWTGDAGLGASLADMIAWEQAIDRQRNDPDGFYNRLSAPVYFDCGAQAGYGFGLGREMRHGRLITGHGGALRGWRSHRLHVASERLSVVVLFNHMSDARQAACDVLDAVQGTHATAMPSAGSPPGDWNGVFQDVETGLAVRLAIHASGKLALRYLSGVEMLEIDSPDVARSAQCTLHRRGPDFEMTRSLDHRSTRLVPIVGAARADFSGRYACPELGLDAQLTIMDAGTILYGAFSGTFGQGRMERLVHLAGDLWALPCPRALDVAAPGDWTLAVLRTGEGSVSGLRVGCWLARDLVYQRV